MKYVLKVSGWCVALVSACAAAPACAEDFARHFALELQDGAAYYSVTLPAAVYAASQRNDLGDLRVFNGADEAVPYSLEAPREPARTPPTLHQVRWFPLRPISPGRAGAPLGVTIAADGSLRASAAPPGRAQHDTDLVDAGTASREGRASALLVHLRDDNYQGRVSVESSDDLRNWQPAGDAQLLKVNYNGSTLSQNRIELNGAHARYLRLRWLDGSPYVETIDVEVQAAGAPHLPLADTQREWREGIVAQAGPKAGEYFFSTGGPYPVDRLRLNLPQPNTVAPAVVYSRSQLGAVWREVARATLFRLHNGEFEQNNPSLQLMPDSDRQWRVVVDTRNGGLGTGALTVVAGWRPATLTFVARGSAPYTLGVGNAATVSAALSRDALLTGASSVVATARVGEALKGAEHANAQPTANAHVYRRYMLWTALIFAVGLLATIAWRLARTVVRPLSTAAVPGAAASGSFRGALERGANASEAANSEADAAQNSAQGDAKS